MNTCYHTNTVKDQFVSLLPSLNLSELAKLTITINQVAIDQYSVNLNDNQNYNSLTIMPFLEMIDGSISVSLERNGDDFTFVDQGGVIHFGEMKASNLHAKSKPMKKKKTPKKHGSWCFHAYDVLKKTYDNFIFYTHVNGVVTKIYYMRNPEKVETIYKFLKDKSDAWVLRHPSKKTNDQISISESIVKELFKEHEPEVLLIDNTEVLAYID